MDKPNKLKKQAILKQRLSRLLNNNLDFVTVDSAAKAWGIKNDEAKILLYNLCKKGWLSRIKQGYYIPVDLASTTNEPPLEYPWAVATEFFEPCYIAGWTAGEYWDLTEQIFNKVLLLTSKPQRKTEHIINGTIYRLHSIQESMFFGTETIWQGQNKVQISDPSKTIIDMFYKPAYGGGIRQVVEFYKNYLGSKHKNINLLIEYALKLNKGVVFKRLGFITEKFFPQERSIIKDAQRNLSSGYSRLDLKLPKDKLVAKWNLWVSESWLEDIKL